MIAVVCAVAGCGRSNSSASKNKPATVPAPDKSAISAADPSGAKPDGDPARSTAADSVPTDAQPGTPIPGPAGRIEGSVKFVGDPIPKSTIVTNGTDPQICGNEMSKVDVVVSPDSRGIRYVLLWLEGVTLPEGYKPPTDSLVVDNVKCQFEPHAAVLTVGSFVQAKNSDAVLHTTHFYGKALDTNPGLPEKGSVSQKYKIRTVGMLNVKCDKHGWMQAYVRVDPHPFHAVTDGDGKFAIADVPVGTYTLKVWHESFGIQEAAVDVREGEAATMELKYPTEQK